MGNSVRCPACQSPKAATINSRPTDQNSIRRRRECMVCQTRFTTVEVHERAIPLTTETIEILLLEVRAMILNLSRIEQHLQTAGGDDGN